MKFSNKNSSFYNLFGKQQKINRYFVSTHLLKSLFIFSLTLSLFNCSKDDDNTIIENIEPTTQQLLIGKWFYSVTSNGNASACEAQSYYHFIDTENLDYKDVRDDTGGILPSGYEFIEGCLRSNNAPVNYTLNENNDIQFPADFGLTATLKIVSISETKLVLTRGDFIYILTKDL
ncbi:hypothetical protein [Mariniflexile sp.]|uniref:hypothetical protein n=1 Tax=Mariniflexile sp. TaxID=1979402 RepID=UPI004048B71D